jgi:sarcosine oxidase subunit alpha
MFKRLPEVGGDTADAAGQGATGGATVGVTIAGRAFSARAGDTVAAALLAAGFDHCRTTPVSGARRAPYCMMGVCFDCLVSIDGVGNRQACMVRVREGMQIEMQLGKREPGR